MVTGTELPIVQAPMASAQGSAMTIAVSNAGGLGSLPCALLSPEQLRDELEQVQAGTSKPYNVNFFCHREPDEDAVREARWLELLSPFFEEYGIEAPEAGGVPARTAFNDASVDVLETFRPPIVSFHFGLPDTELVRRVKACGAKIFSTATTVQEALWLESRGVDAVIAQGLEAGGHRGFFLCGDLSSQKGTLALVPQIASAVRVPVIAAGGIADARGVSAALSLGAAAVQIGTTYLLCREATIGPLYRSALSSAAASHTALTNLFTGRPARAMVNRIMRELGPIRTEAPAFPRAAIAIAALRAAAEAKGSTDFTSLWCGQNPSGCRESGAAEMTRSLAAA